MANQRYIHDTIWTDAYFQTLEPDAKLLFIYLLTNEHLEVSGIYQITARTIANETGLEHEAVNILLDDLAGANKIIYSEDEHVVGIVNYHKHNGLINNPKYRRAIEKSIHKLDETIQSLFCERLGIDWVSIGNPVFSPKLNQTKLNQTKLNQTKLNQTKPNSTKPQITKPPEPQIGYDADAHRADLQSIATPTETATATNSDVSPKHVSAIATLKQHIAEGKIIETDDTEYIATTSAAQQKQTEATRKTRITPKIECDAWDKEDPKWFLKYITLTDKQMGNDADKYGAAKVGMYLRILARRIRMGRLDVDSPISYYRTAIRDNWSLEEAAGWKEGAE